ncbi:MAG: hypothetical protein HQ557_15415 [Bacteroidetes bacterium]|nr:hypothetical protein [Bacteroidota bacterium]
MNDSRYVEYPGQFIKAIEILYKDFETLFDYIEPSDENEKCYSFRIHELMLRTCTEIEANLKGILQSNGYKRFNKKGEEVSNYCMDKDYCKIEKTHHLSSYEVHIPHWRGVNKIRKPFAMWFEMTNFEALPWYQAYNSVKHNRFEEFSKANFGNVIEALCGLIILLASQFYNSNFAAAHVGFAIGGVSFSDGLNSAIGTPFRVKFPDDWTEEEKYEFKWELIKDDPEPFSRLDF